MTKIKLLVTNPKHIWDGRAKCGESPLWDPVNNILYWVDIDGCMAHSYNFFKKKVNTWQFPEKTSWLLPRKNKSSFIAG